MFISHMIGPVAQTAHQDRQREHAAERRFTQAHASARKANTGAGGVSRELAMVTWFAGAYLPPTESFGRTRLQSRAALRRNSTTAGVSWAAAATTWLNRAANRLYGRRERIVAPCPELLPIRVANEDGSY
jgi:hypothetical protein